MLISVVAFAWRCPICSIGTTHRMMIPVMRRIPDLGIFFSTLIRLPH